MPGRRQSSSQNAIPVAAGKLPMCTECEGAPFQRWMGCCIDFGKENSDIFGHWSGACVCRTIFGASNSRCRMLADALRNRRNADFWRVAGEWGDEECRKHVRCIDHRPVLRFCTWQSTTAIPPGATSRLSRRSWTGVHLWSRRIAIAALHWLMQSKFGMSELFAFFLREEQTASRHARLVAKRHH